MAVAMRELPGPVQDWLGRLPEEAEVELALLGLIALHDPPRPDVGEVIQTAREAGIKVGMITGDHPATAAAIAREIGLMGSPSGLHSAPWRTALPWEAARAARAVLVAAAIALPSMAASGW